MNLPEKILLLNKIDKTYGIAARQNVKNFLEAMPEGSITWEDEASECYSTGLLAGMAIFLRMQGYSRDVAKAIVEEVTIAFEA